MEELIFFGLIGGYVYMLIFHTAKAKEIDEMGYDNVRRTTGGLVKAGRMGYKAYRMFRR
jgi:hypothetical protein